MGAPAVSVVVPILDAEHRLDRLHEEVRRATSRLEGTVELVLVDDGSTDGTWPVIGRIVERDPDATGLRLAGNVGQVGALCAGFSVARGAVVVMVDDDLETQPDAIPDLVAAVHAGADFASGRRRGQRPRLRAVGSWLYNARLRGWGLPFHDAGCGTNAMTAAVAAHLAAQGWAIRQQRFKPAVARHTDRIVEVDLATGPPTESHFGLFSLATSWLDVEVHVGGTGLRTVCGVGVGGPLAGAAGALALAARRRATDASPAAIALPALAAAALGATGATTAAMVRALRAQERAAAGAPWIVAERVPVDR